MEEKKDVLVDENCDCADDLLKLSIDDGDENIDDLWDEIDDEDAEVCNAEKCSKKKKLIIAAIALCVAAAVIAVIICKKSKKNK